MSIKTLTEILNLSLELKDYEERVQKRYDYIQEQLEKDPEFVRQTKLLLSHDVKRDLEYNKVFFEKHQTWVNNLFYYTNDFFLKSNQQDGSITYSYFVELLLRYEN